MTAVKITSLTIRDQEPNAGGTRVLAYFDCEIFDGYLILRGCAFIKTPKNGFTVWPPRGEQSAVRHSVQIKGSALVYAMMAAARDIYRTMGGTEAEWTPTAIVERA